ncbi:MAG: hypothetical protein MJ187_00245 [Alphaproteobacteria bacterium]|nr:hypothetical protein [Alphaproteobacteria bacterium]
MNQKEKFGAGVDAVEDLLDKEMMPMVERLLEHAKQISKKTEKYSDNYVDEYKIDVIGEKPAFSIRYYSSESVFVLDLQDGKGFIRLPKRSTDTIERLLIERMDIIKRDEKKINVENDLKRVSAYLQSIRQ